jgi:hypothetical protein
MPSGVAPPDHVLEARRKLAPILDPRGSASPANMAELALLLAEARPAKRARRVLSTRRAGAASFLAGLVTTLAAP